MSLAVVSVRNLDAGSTTFINRLQANSPSGFDGGLDGDDSFKTGGNSPGRIFYYDRLDQTFLAMEQSQARTQWARIDPLHAQLGYGPGTLNEVYADIASTGPGQQNFGVGYNDIAQNRQRIFGQQNSGLVVEVNHTDLTSWWLEDVGGIQSALPWRQGSGIFTTGSSGGIVQGFRPNTSAKQAIIFEEAESATWPAGYMLQSNTPIHDDAGAGVLLYDKCLVQVDLADNSDPGPPGGNGKALVVPVPAWYTSFIPGNTHPTAHAGPLAGFNMWFDQLQWVADGDSTPAVPKGRIFMFNFNQGVNDEHRVPSSVNATVGSVVHKFVKVIEWNPTAKDPDVGEISRVHLRQILLSQILLTELTPAESGGIGEFGTVGAYFPQMIFHPPTETIRISINTWNTEGPGSNGDSTELAFSLQAAVSSISTPTAVSQPETGKTIQFKAEAVGDIGEQISGIDLDWTLDRRSTIGEDIGNPGPLGVATVANFPIDGETATDNSLEVFENGVLLSVTTHYTVNLNTGQITGVGSKFEAGKIYTASYEHTTVGVQSPHGILRTTQSRTNAVGVAFASIEVPDDDAIAGEFDALEAVEAS